MVAGCPQLGAALVNIRSGTRELAKLRAAGFSTTLQHGAPLSVLLRDPLTRRACGMAEVRTLDHGLSIGSR